MIKERKILSLAEAGEYIDKGESGSETDVKGFIKKFSKLNLKNSKELREKLEALDLMKLKEEHIIKIIDILPEDEEELNKIFVGVGLDEDEIKKILETIKEFK